MQQQDKYRIALLAAFAIALQGFERFIPAPLPWMKPGFANMVTLVALMLYGFRTALLVTLVRVVAGSFLFGTFLGPAFVLSISAGVASTTAMGIVHKSTGRLFSPFGVSLVGAVSHNLAQVAVASVLFIQNREALAILTPFILFIGTLTGALNGCLSIFILDHLKKTSHTIQNTP